MSKVVVDNSFKPKILSTKSFFSFRNLRSLSKELIIFAVIFFAIMAWQTRDMLATDGSVQISQKVLPSLKGDTMPLTENGRPTLIYFFAPWCNICKMSIGNLDGINTDKFNIVTVALDYNSVEAVEEFAADQSLSVPVLLGTQELKSEFQIKGYPSYYLLDENRKVVSKSYGYSSSLGMKLRAWANG
ncbi:TlpA family protein disulfide reductase [Alteromonadaceae bacterium M269]|nr:TlpA family protein disulfide reductase [Alteromonadaceae bacterium M269]